MNVLLYGTNDRNSLAIAYTMLVSGMFKKCECSAMNNDPKEFDTEYPIPRDLYIGEKVTDENVGNYPEFIKTVGCNDDINLHCVCALDESDTNRVTFVCLSIDKGAISFTGNIEKKEAERILRQLFEKAKEYEQQQ